MNKEIKFDSISYKINYKDKKNDNSMGMILYKQGIIEIDESMPKDIQSLTLFHECTHLVLAQLGESDLNNNEGFVERLANSFYRLVKENKHLVE